MSETTRLIAFDPQLDKRVVQIHLQRVEVAHDIAIKYVFRLTSRGRINIDIPTAKGVFLANLAIEIARDLRRTYKTRSLVMRKASTRSPRS